MFHKQLEAMLRSGAYSLVLESAREYVSRNQAPSDDAVWVAIMACRAAGHLRAWGDAVAWGHRARAMGPCPAEASGWLHLLIGTASMYTCNIHVARRELEAFHAVAADCPQLLRFIPDCTFNQGHVMRYFDDLEAEVAFFRQAQELYRGQGRSRQVLQCSAEMASSYLLHGVPELALQLLETVALEIEHQPDQELEIDLQIQRAMYQRLQGAIGQSRDLCESLNSRADLMDRQRAELSLLMAENALSMGMLDEAHQLVALAYASALNDWWPLQAHRIEKLRDSMQNRTGHVSALAGGSRPLNASLRQPERPNRTLGAAHN